jgi:hypothetical protein
MIIVSNIIAIILYLRNYLEWIGKKKNRLIINLNNFKASIKYTRNYKIITQNQIIMLQTNKF